MSEQQMNDSTFSRLFIIMIIAMTIMAVIIAALASIAASGVNTKLKERSELENSDAIAQSIAPVGQFSATTVEATPVSTEPLTGEQAYASCAACHVSGTLDAPIVGDTESWANRIAKGIDVLYENAINGINNMPAKGGNTLLSDDDVKAAVDYMVEKSQ